ncbi:SGNH/GDSL hydrolase family protein [Mesomycoplasma bovoculi]|uniref:Lipoprotein, GDSL-like lipase family n=1 Tax=Mesomycoplasma bovoculi M165/69 TaxID=743966 RepID=W5UST5_9BACT|nr:SGNH/GDSL hydrolase family protein [Mesomycoplasma bovoculi]AHH45274.1 lipoprotein, GDSL-like lipase family [Mesomycoplasma bovoculi M165/69]
MKKSFILNKSVKGLIGAALLSSTVLVIAACNINQNNDNKSTQFNSSHKIQKTLIKKVKYLAIGDSVTAGFNLDNRIDSRGNMENGQVSGLSYPAFFAHYLQQINHDSLVSFDNLALSGTTVKNWLYLLDPENSEYKKFDKTFLKYANNIDKLTNSPYGKQISDVFGNFNSEKYPVFIQKIKEANLLTFTLGANDLFQSLNLSYLTSLTDNPGSKAVIAEQIQRDVAKALADIKANLTKFIAKLKEINPDLSINILGYQDLSSSAIKFVSSLLKNEFGFTQDFGHTIISSLNKNIKEVASHEEINYIDPYDQNDWQNNKIFGVDLDIHPSVKGYKKMAQALLYKLALDQSNLINLKGVDIDFLEKSKGDYARVLDIASNQDIVSKVSDASVLETSEFETQNEQKLTSYQASAQNMFVAFLDTNSVIEKWMINILSKSGDFQSIAKVFLKQNTADARNKTREFLKELVQSPILSQILEALRSYIEEVKEKNLWDKITFDSIIDGVSRKFLLEGGLPALINFVLSNKWVSQQPQVLKDALFKTVFGSTSIQNRVLSLFGDDNIDSNDWRVIFEFDSTKALFSKVLDELLDNGATYKNSTNFADLVTNFVKNDANQSVIIDFVQNFTTEALKQPVFTTLLVDLIDKQVNIKLSEEEKNGISSALLGISENITSTRTFKNLAKTIAISLTNGLKNINSNFDKTELTDLFVGTMATSFKNFFSDKSNLLILVQDLLQSKLNEKQVEFLSKLLQKLSSIIPSLELSTFYSTSAKNYSVVKIIFDSAKEFLQEDSFKQINKLFETALKDFFITHRDKYSSSIDFDSFVFQLVANNADELKEIIYNFLLSQGKKDNFSSAVGTLLSGLLDKYNYKSETKSTIAKIITGILEDFAKHDKEANKDNIITLLLDKFVKEMKDYVTKNNAGQDLAKDGYNKSSDTNGQTKYADQYLTLRRKLNFNDFLAQFGQNTLKDSSFLYSTLKSFARVFETGQNKLTTDELANAIFDILHSKPVLEYFKNIIPAGNDEQLRQELANIIEKFLNSNAFLELLKGGMEFIFNTKNLEQHKTLSDLLLAFLKEKHDLVEKAIAIFITSDDGSSSLNNILDRLLKANDISLESSNLETLQQIIKDFAHQTSLAIQNKTQDNYKPLTINAAISFVITKLFSSNQQEFNNSLTDLVSSFVYDISHIYFKNPTDSQHTKINAGKLLTLVKGFLNTQFATKAFNEKFGTETGPQIKALISSFLDIPGTQTFLTKIFELIAKQQVEQNKSLFEVLKEVVNDQEFKKIFVDFIKSINNNELASKLKPVLGKLLGVELDDQQIASFLKWVKLILTDNIDAKTHNYKDGNDLINTIIKVLNGLFEARKNNNNFDFAELQKHFGTEEFIVNFIKQLAATFGSGEKEEDKVNDEDRKHIGQLVISILKSSFIAKTIDSMDLSSLRTYLGEEYDTDVNHIKGFIKKLISQEGNVDFIVNLLNEVGKNIDKYKDATSIVDLLRKIIQNNKQLIEEYLWQLIDFAVNDADMGKIFAKIIAKQLKLDTAEMQEADYNFISGFLKGLIDRGKQSQIVTTILDEVVDQIGKSTETQFDSNFFTNIFNSISGAKLFNFDFVIKIDNELKQQATPVSSDEQWKKLDGKTDKSPFTAKEFAEFFDTILVKAPQWNKNKQDSGSVILKGLNNIPYTGFNFIDVIFSGGSSAKGAKTQLSSIADIFKQVYLSVKDKVNYSNFKDTAEGRTLYRLMFLTLFYAWESQFKNASYFIYSVGFYGGFGETSTASGQIIKAFKDALPNGSDKSEYDKFIDALKGDPWKKPNHWWEIGSWYKAYNVKPSDMLTMIYYNTSSNPFTNTKTKQAAKTEEPTLKDQILEQIRQGSFDGWENPKS